LNVAMSAEAVLVLASASPRRAQLLAQIGVPHRVLPADIDERRAAGEDAEQCVLRLACQKARQVCSRLQEQAALQPLSSTPLPVLGADTGVVVDGELLGKPRDRADALAMLARLSGRTHLVLSAVALASATELRSALSRSEVRFRRLSREECSA
jgi:septum formation protein